MLLMSLYIIYLYLLSSINLFLGRTSLIYAAKSNNTDTVRILLEHGANVNTMHEVGKLHIIIAAISSYPSIYNLYTGWTKIKCVF